MHFSKGHRCYRFTETCYVCICVPWSQSGTFL
uniref:Uncharacterized protein n=1 Tax=Anguilla anguilla TaxID=7936 RepID=A0A0E9V222_ANGAN